ncbi:MAG: CBS domain-containing protein, partial [Eubacteriales bacterium]
MKIILGHKHLDFDALASMVAAQKIFTDAVMVREGKAGSFVQDFMALAKEQLPVLQFKNIDVDKVEKIILVDTHDLNRAVGNADILNKLKKVDILIYDHHPYLGPQKANILIQPLGACTTLLVEELIRKNIKISSFDATLLALGIYDDTGSLLFENTTARDVMAAGYLLEQGAQLGVVGEYLRRPLSAEQLKMFQQLLDNGVTEKYQKFPVYISYAESTEYFGGLALLAHRVGELESADVWFLIVKMDNRVYVVGRSRGNGIAVNKIMEVFGGAGHEKAASASIKDGKVSTVIEKLKEEIQLRIKEQNIVRDIMSYPVKTVSEDAKMEDVGKLLLRYGHTGFPVVNNEKLVGVISRRDVDKALKHNLNHAPVSGFMTKEVIYVSPEVGWEDVQKIMVQNDIGRLPVVENGNIVGIVSRSDLLRLVYGSVVPTSVNLAKERSLARRQDILNLIDDLPENIKTVLEILKKVAHIRGNPVFLVGGFVRDLLLGVPTKDLDVVVEGSGIDFAKKLMEIVKIEKVTFHEIFGTASIILEDGTQLDIAGTRSEEYEYPGALPIVEESTLKEDLFRRDFTINAMALCLDSKRYGEVVDFYGGMRDLQQKEIRFLHNLSFIDDPTRILRAVRFAGRYQFNMAKVTKDAVFTALNANVFEKISIERFTEELLLIYKEQNYQSIISLLVELNINNNWFKNDYLWNYKENEDNVISWSFEKRFLGSIKYLEDNEIGSMLDRLKLSKAFVLKI